MPTAAYPSSVSVPATGADVQRRNVAHIGLVLVGTGLAFVALALLAPALLLDMYVLAASPATTPAMDASARFGAALFGALTMGWGVTLQQLGAGADLRRAVTVGTLVWFVVDSAASVAVGYAWNTLLNVGFATLILVLLRRGGR